eukprot:COSAG02_NODE_404_length_23022_cov_305.366008_12_plen_566_part_00
MGLPAGSNLEILDTGPLAWRRLMAFTKYRADSGAFSWMSTHSLLWMISHCVVVLCTAAILASAAYLATVLVPLLAAVLLSFVLLPVVHLLERRPPVLCGRARCQQRCTPRPAGQRLPGCAAQCRGGATSFFEGIRLLRLPRVANVALTLGLVVLAARSTISGVYAEISVFVQDDKQRIDEGFTALLQDTVLKLLDPARSDQAAQLDSNSWLVCQLPDGERVERWTPEPHTRGNEGCLAHRVGGECACAGNLFRYNADTSVEVPLDAYGHDMATSVVGLAEFMLVRAVHCIWPDSAQQSTSEASDPWTVGGAINRGQARTAEASLADWWAGQAVAVVENTLGILVLVALCLWIDLPAATQAASVHTAAKAQTGLWQRMSLGLAARAVHAYAIIRLIGAAWLGGSSWLILQLFGAVYSKEAVVGAQGQSSVALPLTLTVLTMVLHFIHPALGMVWWLTLGVAPLVGFDPNISNGSAVVLLVLLGIPHVVSYTLLEPWLWRRLCSKQVADAVGGMPRPVASIVFIVLMGRGLVSALALWLAVPVLLLVKLTLSHTKHPTAEYIAAEWL